MIVRASAQYASPLPMRAHHNQYMDDGFRRLLFAFADCLNCYTRRLGCLLDDVELLCGLPVRDAPGS